MMAPHPDTRSSRARPWIELGVGFAVGYVLGRQRGKPPEAIEPPPPRGETILHAVVRSTITALAAVVVKRVLAHVPVLRDDAKLS